VTSATAHARPESESRNGFSKGREAFRNWRRSRPFWGGLLVLFAGIPIIYFPYNDLSVGALRIHMATTAGAGALLIGLLLFALGVSVWFQPLIRIFAGIAAIVLALVSLPISNFGGFGLGLFPGLIGGALVCSWAPLKQDSVDQAPAAEEPDHEGEFEGPESKLTELMVPHEESAANEAPFPGQTHATEQTYATEQFPAVEQAHDRATGGHGGE
jgi:hypothetical protein